MSNVIETLSPFKVRVSREGVRSFNRGWPCSTLRDRSYWFEFDSNGHLVDTDMPHTDDGPAASALSEDAKAFCFESVIPDWAP